MCVGQDIRSLEQSLIQAYQSKAEEAVRRPDVQHAIFRLSYVTQEGVNVDAPIYAEFSTNSEFDRFVETAHTIRRKGDLFIGAYHKGSGTW